MSYVMSVMRGWNKVWKGAGMKFERFRFLIDWTWFYFIPSIVLTVNEPQYYNYNFSISVHWLGLHVRWQWMEGEQG